MNSSITIRPYETKDKEDIIRLIRLNTPEFFAPEEEEDLSFYLDNEIERYFVLLNDEQIVGCGGINFANNATIGKISWDIFHPEYQGQSLGTTLMKHRLDILQAMPSIVKITVRTSQLVYKFYEKQGFELLEIAENFWAEGIDMYYMEFKKQILKGYIQF